MSITKEVTIDQITVTENGIVLYREATRILEDGVQLSQTFHRTSLIPGQDLTDVPDRVKQVCEADWTPEVIAAYEAQQAANQPKGE